MSFLWVKCGISKRYNLRSRRRETGHLVFATLHTTDAPQTVDRIIDVFEPDAQQQIRMQLATVLQAIISQTLLMRKDGEGRVAAFEVLV